MKSVIIIGAGIGGLECGYILAKHGMRVTILEHDAQVGGCLQTFKRGGTLFDTGFHYVGGLGEGESLHWLFRYFDLLDLPWVRMDEECFDEVVIGEESYPFANGHKRFVERLSERFPHEREGLTKYASFLRQVGEHITDSFSPRDANEFLATSLFARSAYGYLCETIKDPLLRKVLSGTSLKMELCAETLPLYVFAQINNSYIQSAWRLRGGGGQIVEHLADSIRAMGGEVRTNATVTRLVEANGQITQVEVNGEEMLSADYVISSLHPALTVSLVQESAMLRNVYRRRMESLRNSFGMFTANIRLKPESLLYENRNIFVHKADADLWHVGGKGVESVLVNYAIPEKGEMYAPSIDLLTPMRWEEVEHWNAAPIGHRGDDYVAFKQDVTEQCIRLAERRIPGLRDAIEKIYTSTPLSYYSYKLSREGSAYGICKDYNNPMATVLSPRTPIPNLLLTGQNLNLHGVLGTSMTSFFTCAELVGMEPLVKELKNQ